LEISMTDAYRSDRIRGKTVLWTWTDGATKGITHEHVFHPEGTVEWREIDKDSKPPSGAELRESGPAREKVEYAALEAGDDVCAVSYLAPSGYTLTVVLNFRSHSMVGFASGANEWYPVRGTFEIVP
jgi:MoaF N-terminal domain